MEQPFKPREGAALVRATNAFAEEDIGRTWRLFAITVLVWFLFALVAAFGPWWPLQLGAAAGAGLTIVRIFIFQHDYQHGAIFRKSRLAEPLMFLVGMFTMNPPSVWQETHDYHHKNNAKMLGASIGSYPVVTTRMWRMMSPSQRFWYAFARNPLTILLAYFTIFTGGMCLAAFLRQPKVHWHALLSLVLHYGTLVTLALTLGGRATFFGYFLPAWLSFVAGAYLFYVQHNFPDIRLVDRKQWNYNFAALNSSSMMEMSPWMHWFTGNIGYHHVHHLNHRIPFYRLPEAMAAMPELQHPGTTSWALGDILACCRLKLWDADREKMVGWEAVRSSGADPVPRVS